MVSVKATKIIPESRLLDDALDVVQAFVDVETVRFYFGELGFNQMEEHDLRRCKLAIERQRMPRMESVHDAVIWMGENARCKAAHLLKDRAVRARQKA